VNQFASHCDRNNGRTEASWYHGHIRGRALPPWPLGAARRAVRRGRRCRRSRIQGDRGASAQRRRTQEGSATRAEAWERKPTAEAVLRRLRRRAPRAAERITPLRDDAFEPHFAGMSDDGGAVAFHMLVEAQAKVSFGRHTSKRGLAYFQRITPHVVAVQLDRPAPRARPSYTLGADRPSARREARLK